MSRLERLEAPAGGRFTVDLAALVRNWRALARASAPAETGAAVKADAYGTGIERTAAALAGAGCRTFFVALPAEGVRVRAAAPDADVYVLNGFTAGAGALYRARRLRPVIGTPAEIADWLGETGGLGEPVAIHVDTGMNRLGLTLAEAGALAADPATRARLRPALVMSHLACADVPDHPLNGLQMERFAAARRLFPDLPGSLANSAAIAALPAARHDLVRPGIALYGGRWAASAPPLETVATLEARVIQVREIAAGESVGYGAAYTATRPSRIAILGLGYADGYPRSAAREGAVAAVAGRLVPLAGRVSMDLLAVDVTDLPDRDLRGRWVELFGPTVPLDAVAARCGTIGYELLASVGARVERRYR
jgi:alanine racemase